VAMQAPSVVPGVRTGGLQGEAVARHSQPGPAIPPMRSFQNPPSNLAIPEQPSKLQFPTIADVIGADNLTVESPSIDNAMQSLEKILPNIQGRIQGRLVDEKGRGKPGDVVLAVLIPSASYGHLTTELIKHGAVAVGVGAEDGHLAPSPKEGNNVLLYIRFVSSANTH
jgi:hypothetical protein